MDIFKAICELLDKHNITYTVLEHTPVYTSEQAAKVRGRGAEALKHGAKAMVLRSGGTFYQFVIAANERMDFKRVKKILNSSSVTLATPEEVKEVTGLTIGSIPPFGNLFNLDVYVDKSLLQVEEIDFSAGSHDKSITMKLKDYLEIVKPKVVNFRKED